MKKGEVNQKIEINKMLPAVAFLEPSQSDKILLRKAYVVTT
jgi:hypothetical protein